MSVPRLHFTASGKQAVPMHVNVPQHRKSTPRNACNSHVFYDSEYIFAGRALGGGASNRGRHECSGNTPHGVQVEMIHNI